MAVCATPSCRKRKDLNADGVCPTCILHSQHKEHSCKQCKNPITDADKALVCDKCSALCHIQCTSVPEELFDLLVGNDAEDGLRWFCHECRNPPPSSVVTESSQVETNNVNSSVNQQTKVCDKLKVGTCPHGVTGKTLNSLTLKFANDTLTMVHMVVMAAMVQVLTCFTLCYGYAVVLFGIVNVIRQIASCTTLRGPTGAGLDILIDSLLMPNANNLRQA